MSSEHERALRCERDEWLEFHDGPREKRSHYIDLAFEDICDEKKEKPWLRSGWVTHTKYEGRLWFYPRPQWIKNDAEWNKRASEIVRIQEGRYTQDIKKICSLPQPVGIMKDKTGQVRGFCMRLCSPGKEDDVQSLGEWLRARRASQSPSLSDLELARILWRLFEIKVLLDHASFKGEGRRVPLENLHGAIDMSCVFVVPLAKTNPKDWNSFTLILGWGDSPPRFDRDYQALGAIAYELMCTNDMTDSKVIQDDGLMHAELNRFRCKTKGEEGEVEKKNEKEESPKHLNLAFREYFSMVWGLFEHEQIILRTWMGMLFSRAVRLYKKI